MMASPHLQTQQQLSKKLSSGSTPSANSGKQDSPPHTSTPYTGALESILTYGLHPGLGAAACISISISSDASHILQGDLFIKMRMGYSFQSISAHFKAPGDTYQDEQLR